MITIRSLKFNYPTGEFRITNIGFVFQDFELLDYLSVLDNILHPYRITGVLRLDSDVRFCNSPR